MNWVAEQELKMNPENKADAGTQGWTPGEIAGAIRFFGDSVVPDGTDVRVLVIQVNARLPKGVQDWLLDETFHFFVAGHGQLGEFYPLMIRDPHGADFPGVEIENGLIMVRMIFLSEQLVTMPPEEAEWTVAHEIAHSRLNHYRGETSCDAEVDADELATSWGFREPEDREEVGEKFR